MLINTEATTTSTHNNITPTNNGPDTKKQNKNKKLQLLNS